MKAQITKIGNSRGIRIPKAILEQCGFGKVVNLEINGQKLIVSPAPEPRKGWQKKLYLAELGESFDSLLSNPQDLAELEAENKFWETTLADGLDDASSKGEVWDINLDPAEGHEQAKTRPCVVISNDMMNTMMGLSIVVPFTGTPHYSKSGNLSPAMVEVKPPAGGFTKMSYSMAYQVRTVSHSRFSKKRGSVNQHTLDAIVRSVQDIIAF